MGGMSNLRPPRKLLAIAASSAASVLLVGCSQEIMGSAVGEPAFSLDGGEPSDAGDASASDAGDAAPDAPIKVDAGVIAPPLDGGDGG